MVELKKEDKVRVKPENGSRVGQVGVIDHVDSRGCSDENARVDFEGGENTHIYTKYLELVNPNAKPKIPTHLVVWDTDCGDPHKEVYSEAEAKREVLKLYDKRDVINTSIKVYKVSEVKKPILRVGFEKA